MGRKKDNRYYVGGTGGGINQKKNYCPVAQFSRVLLGVRSMTMVTVDVQCRFLAENQLVRRSTMDGARVVMLPFCQKVLIRVDAFVPSST